MSLDLAGRVRAAASASDLVKAIASVCRDDGRQFVLGDVPLRPLYRDEIVQLERHGNTCADWSRVRVADGFDGRKVRHSTFAGTVLLGRFTSQVHVADGLELPAGISHSTIADCIIGDDVLIRDVGLLANYVVARGALLIDCGEIRCELRTTFGNGMRIPVGIESGGREVAIYGEISLELAAGVARSRGQRDLLRAYQEAVDDYTAQVVSGRGIIEPNAVLRNTPSIRNTYVGAHARIEGATLVSDSTLLSNADEPVQVASGACVTGSVLQWGSRVTTLALVDQSVLIEHAQAEGHGKVRQSILGPNTGVAGGEVVCSLLGPFVGFHHQALLIATFWPEGKGNVSYGANVGANHTSRAPDQEFWPGEGAFLGLGAHIKFPADFSRAPYTVVGCGITTLPQKLCFPFSLINSPSLALPGISPAFNEIIPAWLLSENLFAIKRNEGKYQARNRARRAQFEYAVFRPDIVDLMRDACRRLEAVRDLKKVYTDRDIEGLGKNFLLEENRRKAIETYRFFIRYYALLRLLEQVQQLASRESPAVPYHGHSHGRQIDSLLETATADPRWEHARRILLDELALPDVLSGLRQLPDILEKIARDVESSKARDDERGPRIIDDYADVHVPAARNPFVQQTWAETRRLQAETEQLIHLLDERPHLGNGNGRAAQARGDKVVADRDDH